MRILQTQNSCSEPFVLWIGSAFTEQFRIGVNSSAWQRKKRDKKNLLERKNPWAKVRWQVWNRQEVNLLVSSPRQASGSSLRENTQDFESLSETIRFTRVCEDAIFVHRVSAGMSYKTRPDEDDGFGQKAEQSEACLAKSKTSIQETGAAHVTRQTSIQETGADTLSVFASQACLFTQRTIPTTERKWKVIPANSSYGGALPTAVSKMVTRLVRHYDQDERKPDAALHWDTIRPLLLKPFAKHGARDFSEKDWLRLNHQGSSKTRFENCEDSNNSLAYFRAIQGHSRGLTIAPELMEQIPIPYNLKEFFFHWGCSFSIQSILENGLIPGGKESKEGRQTIFFTQLDPFEENSGAEEPRDDFTIPQKVHRHSNRKRNQDAVYLVKLFPSTRSRIAILANEVTCINRTQSSASRLHQQSYL